MAIINSESKSRYELTKGGILVGFVSYRTEDGALVFTHTEIDPQIEGKGHGSALVRGALDDVRARGLKVVPVCPFVKEFIAREPSYADLVA